VITSPSLTEQSERVRSGRPQERAIRSCSKNAESLSPARDDRHVRLLDAGRDGQQERSRSRV
jgi:hypothetical protein